MEVKELKELSNLLQVSDPAKFLIKFIDKLNQNIVGKWTPIYTKSQGQTIKDFKKNNITFISKLFSSL